jgi:hypothetical protein
MSKDQTRRSGVNGSLPLRKFTGSNDSKGSNGSKRFERLEQLERFERSLTNSRFAPRSRAIGLTAESGLNSTPDFTSGRKQFLKGY